MVEYAKLGTQGGNTLILTFVLVQVFKLGNLLVRRMVLHQNDPPEQQPPAKKPHRTKENP